MPDQALPAGSSKTAAIKKVNELFANLLAKQPKGFATSSMGKFDAFREYLAGALKLGDWERYTYAVGSAGIAHNFGSRWSQNNAFSGSHVPLGIGFLSIPEGNDTDELVEKAANTSVKFVDGQRPTSYEAIIIFAQPPGTAILKAHTILALPGSEVAKGLDDLFPGTRLRTVTWTRSTQPPLKPVAPSPEQHHVPSKPLDGALLGALESSLSEANYRAPAGLSSRVICSLAAKRFLILAGLSGSGKTLLAIAIAHWLATQKDQVQIVAVGADWTSSHHLLGYADALDPNGYVRTPALDLLIKANASPELPFFLVLDEMNLSHVERYFSDFLSTMESGQPIDLHGGADARNGVPGSIAFPQNLFIVGTINVDETTYMFSPKVLDRANVLEFTISEVQLSAYLAAGGQFNLGAVAGQGKEYGASLVDFSIQPLGIDELTDETESGAVREALVKLFAATDRAGLQFAYRTTREMVRYVIAHRYLSGESWHPLSAFDALIAQRILPRLSGDGAKLKPILLAIITFCEAVDIEHSKIGGDMEKRWAELQSLDVQAIDSACAKLKESWPITSSKVTRMLKRLSEHGFTTAIEA